MVNFHRAICTPHTPENVTENIENLIIEHLRAMRGDLGQVKDDIGTVKLRLTSLESRVASVHASLVEACWIFAFNRLASPSMLIAP